MKFKYIVFVICTATITYLHSTATMECRWHAAYFDAVFIGNYGTADKELERYFNNVLSHANVIIQLDSAFRALRKVGKLEHFKRWCLCDYYMRCYEYKDRRSAPRAPWHEGDTIYLCVTDSLSINRVLAEYYGIEDVIISPGRPSGMWLYSLHTGFWKDRYHARQYPDTLWKLSSRGDSALLWLYIEGGYSVEHNFYQHETDGYYHQYTGLYLTTNNVLEAQVLLLKYYGIKTTITSHYITPAILRKYAWY